MSEPTLLELLGEMADACDEIVRQAQNVGTDASTTAARATQLRAAAVRLRRGPARVRCPVCATQPGYSCGSTPGSEIFPWHHLERWKLAVYGT